MTTTTKAPTKAWIFTGCRGAYHYDTGIYDTAARPSQLLRVIAVQLARINRYLGATLCAWPVGIHALAVSKLVEVLGGTPIQCLKGLHHDDHEMLTADVPGPLRAWVKKAINAGQLGEAADWYEQACGEAQSALMEVLGLGVDPEITNDDAGDALVRRCDALVLEAERQLMHYDGPLSGWGVPGLPQTELLAAITVVRASMAIALPQETRDQVNRVLWGRRKDSSAAPAFAYEDAGDAELLRSPHIHEIVDSFIHRDRQLRQRASMPELE